MILTIFLSLFSRLPLAVASPRLASMGMGRPPSHPGDTRTHAPQVNATTQRPTTDNDAKKEGQLERTHSPTISNNAAMTDVQRAFRNEPSEL
ncbi:hypothetical protein SCHPADRAFT_569089 [Schizopora paradoxa]|uniref:Secreted protein n=1 Tax=Schizopora paradoxa TaxID=27342 RepID=A0A0H2RC16_9AGAM|nr:hypothetical protein SCHPADRAFT_569089 [Schizopora paradoxa]